MSIYGKNHYPSPNAATRARARVCAASVQARDAHTREMQQRTLINSDGRECAGAADCMRALRLCQRIVQHTAKINSTFEIHFWLGGSLRANMHQQRVVLLVCVHYYNVASIISTAALLV